MTSISTLAPTRVLRAGFIAALAVMVLVVRPVEGQLLRGRWVDQSQQAIDQYRKTDLHVLVLDASGQPTPGAKVHIQQRRHAFIFGVHPDPRAFAQADKRPAISLKAPVWRCFNSVALDDAGAWPKVQSDSQIWDFRIVDRMIEWAEAQNMTLRYGAVTSADPDHAPPWLLQLDDAALEQAVDAHLHRVMTDYRRRVDQFDVHGHMMDHHLVAARLGEAMVRRMHESARAMAPRAKIGVRFENSIHAGRITDLTKTHAHLREQFIPADLIVLDERLAGSLFHAPLSRAMNWLRDLHRPVVIGRLEAGGASPTAAAVNLETFLRVAFAEPMVQGVWLAGVGGELSAPNAALIDEQGQPTPVGEVFDHLVHQVWWTDVTKSADKLGNVRLRVFAGTYHITAELPDGSRAETEAFLSVDPSPRTVMLQPLTTSATKTDSP